MLFIFLMSSGDRDSRLHHHTFYFRHISLRHVRTCDAIRYRKFHKNELNNKAIPAIKRWLDKRLGKLLLTLAHRFPQSLFAMKIRSINKIAFVSVNFWKLLRRRREGKCAYICEKVNPWLRAHWTRHGCEYVRVLEDVYVCVCIRVHVHV